MRVLFITEYDPLNPHVRSGVPFYIWRGLKALPIESSCRVVKDQRSIFQRLKSRMLQIAVPLGFGGKKGFYDAGYSVSKAKSYYNDNIDLNKFDIILSINPITLAFLPPHSGKVLWIDNCIGTYACYPEMQGISGKSMQEGERSEEKAFAEAHLIFTASGWLQQLIVDKYPSWANKISVLPRGANLMKWPTKEIVEQWLQKRTGIAEKRLVHVVSGGWENDRKGSQLTLAVYRLIKKHQPVSLIIIGEVPENDRLHLEKEGVTCIGRVDKHTKEGLKAYLELLGTAHLLLIPSKADGFGIVYAEAAACGLPSIALSVMGVTESVQEGVTGKLFSKDISPEILAENITSLWNNEAEYDELCLSAREYAEAHFKWEVNLQELIGQCRGRRKAS